MSEKTGPELMEEAAQEPTLDELMRRDPATLSDAELRQMIEKFREERAQFIKNDGESAKKKKKSDE